jgi:transposase
MSGTVHADRRSEGDAPQAAELIEGLPAEIVMADTAYDADPLRQAIAAKGAIAVIPNNPSRALKYPLDKHLYAQRHLVECCFSKLKQFRRVATRFEKTARNYRAVVTLAAIILWMRRASGGKPSSQLGELARTDANRCWVDGGLEGGRRDGSGVLSGPAREGAWRSAARGQRRGTRHHPCDRAMLSPIGASALPGAPDAQPRREGLGGSMAGIQGPSYSLLHRAPAAAGYAPPLSCGRQTSSNGCSSKNGEG